MMAYVHASMTGQTRRDVLRALASTVALPAAADVDLEDEQQRVPDLPDRDPFWIVVYAATDYEPHNVIDELGLGMAALAPNEMEADEAFHHVREAARGEYDEQVVQHHAADTWVAHAPEE